MDLAAKDSFLEKGLAMDLGRNRPLWQSKWRIAIIYLALVILVMVVGLLTFMTEIFRTSRPWSVPQLVWLLIAGVFLLAILMMLSKVLRILDTLQDYSTKLEKVIATMEKVRAALVQIDQSTHFSETAKAIAFRDADKQLLREAVFDKLHQQDFEATFELIDEIARRTEYKDLAEQLRAQANTYRDATDAERVNQVIAHIEELFESHQWVKASTEVERLIKAYPDSQNAKAMRQRLFDKKQERKKILLNAWDDAVRRHATDRSLEILRELDMYLTPNEASALQEAARDVFKTKLHNLGVQFSLAISGRQWDRAIEVGEQIVSDFPNSKMAQEIREKMDILRQKVQ